MSRRDLGENNAVKRDHLDVAWKTTFGNRSDFDRDAVDRFQAIINKVERRLEHTEKFIEANQDNISLSYYTEGYYNGRARAFEDVIDIITDVLNEEKDLD